LVAVEVVSDTAPDPVEHARGVAAVGAELQVVNGDRLKVAVDLQAVCPGDACVIAPSRQTQGVLVGAVVIKQRGGQGKLFFRRGGRRYFAKVLGDKPGAEMAVDKVRLLEQVGQQLLVGIDAQQHGVFHGAQQLAPRLFAGGAVGDDLGLHGVIERADCLAFADAMVNTYACGRLPAQHLTGLREETLGRVFGVQAHFHGMAAQGHLFLAQWQWVAGGDQQLPGHQVQAGNQLGDRVLHLQARVHFQEVELTVAVEQKFHGAGADVIHRAPGLERRLAHGLAQFRGHDGAGRFFDDFLVATLDRAVAFAEVDQVAVAVAEQLDFDVTRVDQCLFEDQFVTAEGVLRFGAGGAQLLQQVLGFVHQAHASATAAGAGLDHQRVADAVGLVLQGGVVLGAALVAGDARHFGFQHGEFGPALAAHQFDGLDAGADEDQAGVLARAGETGVFREEAVAGVYGVGAGFFGGLKDGRDVEVGLLYRGGADAHGFVGHLHVQGLGVGVAVDGDGAVAQCLGRALDAAGDFTAVGDQDLVELRHRCFPWD